MKHAVCAVLLRTPFADTDGKALNALDSWISEQNEPLTRPEAIRKLVEQGLGAGAKKQ